MSQTDDNNKDRAVPQSHEVSPSADEDVPPPPGPTQWTRQPVEKPESRSHEVWNHVFCTRFIKFEWNKEKKVWGKFAKDNKIHCKYHDTGECVPGHTGWRDQPGRSVGDIQAHLIKYHSHRVPKLVKAKEETDQKLARAHSSAAKKRVAFTDGPTAPPITTMLRQKITQETYISLIGYLCSKVKISAASLCDNPATQQFMDALAPELPHAVPSSSAVDTYLSEESKFVTACHKELLDSKRMPIFSVACDKWTR